MRDFFQPMGSCKIKPKCNAGKEVSNTSIVPPPIKNCHYINFCQTLLNSKSVNMTNIILKSLPKVNCTEFFSLTVKKSNDYINSFMSDGSTQESAESLKWNKIVSVMRKKSKRKSVVMREPVGKIKVVHELFLNFLQ